jgi:hypothetical protein
MPLEVVCSRTRPKPAGEREVGGAAQHPRGGGGVNPLRPKGANAPRPPPPWAPHEPLWSTPGVSVEACTRSAGFSFFLASSSTLYPQFGLSGPLPLALVALIRYHGPLFHGGHRLGACFPRGFKSPRVNASLSKRRGRPWARAVGGVNPPPPVPRGSPPPAPIGTWFACISSTINRVIQG